MHFLYLILLALAATLPCNAQSEHRKDTDITYRAAEYRTEALLKIMPKAGMRLFPNPAKNSTSLLLNGFDAGTVLVRITDTRGRLQRAEQRILLSGSEEVRLYFSLPAGYYFVTVTQQKKVVTQKLLVR